MVQTTSPDKAPPAGPEAGAARAQRAAAAAPPARSGRRAHPPRFSAARFAVVVLVVGLAATALLAWVVATVNSRNETRLLDGQVRQAGTVIAQVVTDIQTPLASGAEVANFTGGDPNDFRHFMSSYVGPQKTFVSASLWQLGRATPHLIATVGSPSELATRPTQLATFLQRSTRFPALAVTPLLQGPRPRLGYAYAAGNPSSYVAYAETPVPPDRKTAVPKGSAFADLNFAIYIGRLAVPQALLAATQMPLPGPTASTTVPFGTSQLTLVGSAVSPLGGSLSNSLPWIVTGAGILLTLAAAALAHRLVRRRAVAEQLAEENRQLYREQRSIAETLQRSLLPERLPRIRGIEFAVRYVPGASEVDVGGDWYDVIEVDDGFLFVVGDVSGRGLRAATKMAALHYAIRAYAAEGHEPEAILSKLGQLVNLERDGHFATVLCGHVHVESHQVSLVDAGHLAPLVLADGSGYYPEVSVGVPVGVPAPDPDRAGYPTTTIEVPPGATMLAFTDGLIERRNEDLDAGLDRLLALAVAQQGSLEAVVSGLVEELVGEDVHDDTAVLGVRWLT